MYVKRNTNNFSFKWLINSQRPIVTKESTKDELGVFLAPFLSSFTNTLVLSEGVTKPKGQVSN